MDKLITVSKNDVSALFNKFGGENACVVLGDPRLLGNMFDILKSASDREWGGVFANGLNAASQVANGSSLSYGSKAALNMGSFVVSQTYLSMSLKAIYVAKDGARMMSPGAAVAVIGSTFITKVGLAIGLAGEDYHRMRCVGALTELVGNLGTTGVSLTTLSLAALTLPLGVGAALGLAIIAFSAWNAYDECR
jgi:hypothetical protein